MLWKSGQHRNRVMRRLDCQCAIWSLFCVWCGGGPKQNPLLQPIDVAWGTTKQEITLDMDINGNAIVNTAGDPVRSPGNG